MPATWDLAAVWSPRSHCDSGKSLVSLGPFPLPNKTKVWAG